MLLQVEKAVLDALMRQVQDDAQRKAWKPMSAVRVRDSVSFLDPDALTIQMSYRPTGCFYKIDTAMGCTRVRLGDSANGASIVLVGVPAAVGAPSRYLVRNPWKADAPCIAIQGESVVFSRVDYTDHERIYAVESPLHGEDLQDFYRMFCICNSRCQPTLEARPILLPHLAMEHELAKMREVVRWYV